MSRFFLRLQLRCSDAGEKSQRFLGPKSAFPPPEKTLQFLLATTSDCDSSRKIASPLLFCWRWGRLRQKLAAICDCDFWCSQLTSVGSLLGKPLESPQERQRHINMRKISGTPAGHAVGQTVAGVPGIWRCLLSGKEQTHKHKTNVRDCPGTGWVAKFCLCIFFGSVLMGGKKRINKNPQNPVKIWGKLFYLQLELLAYS